MSGFPAKVAESYVGTSRMQQLKSASVWLDELGALCEVAEDLLDTDERQGFCRVRPGEPRESDRVHIVDVVSVTLLVDASACRAHEAITAAESATYPPSSRFRRTTGSGNVGTRLLVSLQGRARVWLPVA